MEFVWVVTVCAGISGWGCGYYQRIPAPSFEACSEQVKAFNYHTNANLSAGENGQAALVVCEVVPSDSDLTPPHPKSWTFKE